MRRVKRNGVLAVALLLLLAAAAIALAQSSAGFELQQYVSGSGGGESSSASYQVDGTVGQALAGDSSTSNTFTLDSGYWVQGAPRNIFLPVVMNQSLVQSRASEPPHATNGPAGTKPPYRAPSSSPNLSGAP